MGWEKIKTEGVMSENDLLSWASHHCDSSLFKIIRERGQDKEEEKEINFVIHGVLS